MRRLNLPPRTNPLVAIADVDNPVIVVTTVAIIITTTDRPLGEKKRLRILILISTCAIWKRLINRIYITVNNSLIFTPF